MKEYSTKVISKTQLLQHRDPIPRRISNLNRCMEVKMQQLPRQQNSHQLRVRLRIRGPFHLVLSMLLRPSLIMSKPYNPHLPKVLRRSQIPRLVVPKTLMGMWMWIWTNLTTKMERRIRYSSAKVFCHAVLALPDTSICYDISGTSPHLQLVKNELPVNSSII